jgi:hypothetical protein
MVSPVLAHYPFSACSAWLQPAFSGRSFDRKKFERRRRKDNDIGKEVRENSASFFIDVCSSWLVT